MAKHHVGEESLPPQQQGDVTVAALTPAQYQEVRREFLQIFQEVLASSVVRCDVNNLIIISEYQTEPSDLTSNLNSHLIDIWIIVETILVLR